jgi:hypothetical protein
MSTPRSNNKSSTFRKLSGNRIYIMTTSRITSGEELKYLNGLAGLRGRGIRGLYIAPVTKGCIWFDSAECAAQGFRISRYGLKDLLNVHAGPDKCQ